MVNLSYNNKHVDSHEIAAHVTMAVLSFLVQSYQLLPLRPR